MGIQKRVLVFYPMNFYEMSAGTHRRVFQVLTYLKERGFSTDLLSLDGYSNKWNEEDRGRRDLCDRIELVVWKPGLFDSRKINKAWLAGDLPDFAIGSIRKKISEMFAARRYDFLIVHYVYWALLAEMAPAGTVSMIDLHDFATIHNFQISGEKKFKLGRMFESEINCISKFKYALSISEEETLILSQFCTDTVFIDLPVFYDYSEAYSEKKFDLLFVGSDNPFNRQGLEWFIEKVHPLLPASVRIACVGKAGKFVQGASNVEIIEHAESLNEFYASSRLAFCPLKGGTGLKVKVIEALSRGIPVITTSWGLRGILKKEENGCVVADDEHDFSTAVLELLSDNAKYEQVRAQGVSFFKRFYSKQTCYEKLDRVFVVRG